MVVIVKMEKEELSVSEGNLHTAMAQDWAPLAGRENW